MFKKVFLLCLSIFFLVACQFENPGGPRICGIITNPGLSRVYFGEQLTLTVDTENFQAEQTHFFWEARYGYISNMRDKTVTWTAPNQELVDTITVFVQDPQLAQPLLSRIEIEVVGHLLTEPRIITFLDSSLETRVRAQIDKAAGLIYNRDVEYLLYLDLSEAAITSLAGLEHFASLRWLNLENNNVTALTPLAGLDKLEELYLENNYISDIGALGTLSSLVKLDLDGNQLSDVSGLSGLTALSDLSLAGNKLQSLGTLSGLSSLNYLNLYGNDLRDISGVARFTTLRELSLSNNANLVDISPLAGLKSLEWLYLQGVGDYSAYQGVLEGLGGVNIVL